jgi:hypothetical protein
MFRPIAAIFRLLQLAETCGYFLLLNTTIVVFMTDIYLTVSLSTHNGDDTPQNYSTVRCLQLTHITVELSCLHLNFESAPF